MFDEGWSDFDAAATLDAAVEFDAEENRAARGKLQAVQHFAALHAELPPASRAASKLRGRERLRVYGGEGCPAIAEFAPAEWGALMKLSTDGAAAYLGEALALPHRFPRIWAKALDGQVIVWRARLVARACLKLSREAAALVDERVVGVIDTVTSYRLHKIIEAVIKEADPEAARKAAEEHARERGVWIQQSDLHGTKTIYVKAAAGDVIRFDATLDDLAWALGVTGDPDPLQARRAKAIGWIAEPRRSLRTPHRRPLPRRPPPPPTPPTATPTAAVVATSYVVAVAEMLTSWVDEESPIARTWSTRTQIAGACRGLVVRRQPGVCPARVTSACLRVARLPNGWR